MENSGSKGEMTIDRKKNLSYAEFKNEYLNKRIPVIITDAIDQWPARAWTPQWFRNSYPGKKISTDLGEMVMEDFIDSITANSDGAGPFLREQPLKDVFPDLMHMVQPTPVYATPNWLGGQYLLPRVNRRLNHESQFINLFASINI